MSTLPHLLFVVVFFSTRGKQATSEDALPQCYFRSYYIFRIHAPPPPFSSIKSIDQADPPNVGLLVVMEKLLVSFTAAIPPKHSCLCCPHCKQLTE